MERHWVACFKSISLSLPVPFLSLSFTRSSTSFAAHTVFTWARQMEGKGRKKQKTERERSKYNKFKISSRSHHEIGNLSARRSRGRCPLCVCPSILLLNWTTLLRRRHYCSCRFAMLFLSSFICMLPGSSGSFNSAVQLFSLFHSLLSALSLSLSLSRSLSLQLLIHAWTTVVVVVVVFLQEEKQFCRRSLYNCSRGSSNAEAARVISCRPYYWAACNDLNWISVHPLFRTTFVQEERRRRRMSEKEEMEARY